MKRLLLSCFAALVALGSEAAVVFTQPPDPARGILVSSWVDPNGSDADMYVYDSFILDADQAITRVTWRGGYFYGAPYGRVNDFSIVFHESTAGGTQPHCTNPQLPEIYLAWYQVGGIAGETPGPVVGGVQMYDYTYALPTPFQASAGVKYWVRIEASQPTYPDWGIAVGTGGNGQHFRFSTGAAQFTFGQGDASFTLENAAPGACSLSCAAAATPQSAIAPVAVGFAGTATPVACVQAPLFDWDFGDGTAHGAGADVSHTYSAPGTYTWTMAASADGAACTKTGSFTVCRLTCTASVPGSAQEHTPVTFTGSGGVTGGCSLPVALAWDFGDGGPPATTAAATHSYASSGAFTWTLTVSAGGRTCVQTGSIAVAAVPPPVVVRIAKTSPPFTLVVTGSNLQRGLRVFINGAEWPGVNWKTVTKVKLGGAGLKAAVPKGADTSFRVVNPDGGEASLTWRW